LKEKQKQKVQKHKVGLEVRTFELYPFLWLRRLNALTLNFFYFAFFKGLAPVVPLAHAPRTSTRPTTSRWPTR
jgi:hypothetical protein